jgi:predicted nucleotide-binding protein
MEGNLSKCVFLIHGRDLSARDQMVKFIESLGLTYLDFDTVSSQLGPAPFIGDIVLSGISKANAVIALFTPDELSAFYSPDSDIPGEWRWQARPNVIFEAGIAFGLAHAHTSGVVPSEFAGEKTILVTFGPDVKMFSDLAGIHYVRMDSPAGKEILRKKLEAVVGPIDRTEGWGDPSISGEFQEWSWTRWLHYDELSTLEKELRAKQVGAMAMSLFDILKQMSSELSDDDFDNLSSKQVMDHVERLLGDREATDVAYWWLVVLGVFRFKGIKRWWDNRSDPRWTDSVSRSEMSERGKMLLLKLRRARRAQP